MTPDPATQPAPPHRRRWPLIAALTIALLLAAGVTTWLVLSRGSTTTVSGEVRLTRAQLDGQPEACYGRGGYADIREGTSVVVTDAAGTTIAITHLDRGSFEHHDGDVDCVLHFAVSVPAGRGFYGVEVSHRGRVQVAEAQAGAVKLAF